MSGAASLQHYLDNRRADDATLHEICALLLTKVSESAAVADEDAAVDFQNDMRRLAVVCGESQLPGETLRTADVAVQLLADYNRDVTVSVRKHQRALGNLVKIVADTVASLTPDNPASADELRRIALRLSGDRVGTNFEELKPGVSQCLQTFRQEIERQKEEMEHLILSLRRNIERGIQPDISQDDIRVDPATSLPERQSCIRAINAPMAAGRRRFVAVFVVTRLRVVNLRFGRDIGDRVLCRFGEYVEQQLPPADRLFRWNGPTLVAVMERNETLERIRAEMRRMADSKADDTLDVDGRKITIPIGLAWSAFQLLSTVKSAERQIDKFAAQHGSGD